MKNVLALDASTKKTGWATLVNGKLEYGAISSSSTLLEKRIGIMRGEILTLIEKYNITHVVIEEVRPDSSPNFNVTKALCWLQGVLATAIYETYPKVVISYIGPSSWRKKLKIQGYRIKREEQKQIDINYANKKYSLALTSKQDDEADAICILDSYFIEDEDIIESAF